MIFYLFLEENSVLATKREAEKINRPDPKTNKGGKKVLTLDEEVANTEPEAGEAGGKPRKILCK